MIIIPKGYIRSKRGAEAGNPIALHLLGSGMTRFDFYR
jgi:hypothetical protein